MKRGLHKKDLTSFDNYKCQHKYQQKKAWTPLISKNVGNLQNSNVRQMFDRVKFIWATEPLALGPLIEGIESGTRGGGGEGAVMSYPTFQPTPLPFQMTNLSSAALFETIDDKLFLEKKQNSY